MTVLKAIEYDLVDRPGSRRPKIDPPDATEASTKPGETASELKYIPRAVKEAEQRRRLAEEPEKVKAHRYLDIRVGDMVRVRGKVKEWSWKSRQGQVMRELQVDSEGLFVRGSPSNRFHILPSHLKQSAAGRCRTAEEAEHHLEVLRLHRERYSKTFIMPDLIREPPEPAPTGFAHQSPCASMSLQSIGLDSQASPTAVSS